jgi:uncharacterized protein (DUF305 family)
MKPRATTDASSHEPYGRLCLMIVLSFIAMYALMYGMVNALANVYMNVNQLYMAGLMAAPMGIIELALMGAMYRDSRLNRVVAAGSFIALAVFWLLLRQQAAVSDRQFLRSMIPHHAGAILMCEQAPVQDAEIKALCRRIIASQQSEIDQMKAKLGALER